MARVLAGAWGRGRVCSRTRSIALKELEVLRLFPGAAACALHAERVPSFGGTWQAWQPGGTQVQVRTSRYLRYSSSSGSAVSCVAVSSGGRLSCEGGGWPWCSARTPRPPPAPPPSSSAAPPHPPPAPSPPSRAKALGASAAAPLELSGGGGRGLKAVPGRLGVPGASTPGEPGAPPAGPRGAGLGCTLPSASPPADVKPRSLCLGSTSHLQQQCEVRSPFLTKAGREVTNGR